MKAPDKATYVTLHFEKAFQPAIDGRENGWRFHCEKSSMRLGGANGIGIADMVETGW